MPSRLALLFTTVLACHGAVAADTPATQLLAPCAVNATPRTVEYPWMSIERWRGMHAEQVARAAKGEVDVMFLGDSITEMWSKPVWDANFGQLKAANFGIGGDHTGNLLWRLQDTAVARLRPKLVVLLIGVNNLNLCGETPEQVFAGIQAVVGRLRAQYPAARILLNGVLPAGAKSDEPVRQRIVALDTMVATLDDGQHVFFHNYGAHFIGADGSLSSANQPDFLHLSEQGYRIWAAAMRPDIERLLKQPGPGAARPVVLADDDVRAFAAAPAGFDQVRPGVAQGRIEEFGYDSDITGTRRKANVYLPAGYMAQRRYPVLYLLHGIAGNQDEWRGYVHAQAILDNLIDDGKAPPMIVVMPNGRALPDDRPPPAADTFTPGHIAGFTAFERELPEVLVPAIDKRYPTLAGGGQRAIAGLSMGGAQALNIGLGHADAFGWVGAFSAAPNLRAAAELLAERGGARPQLLYLSCGNQDGLIGGSQTLHRYLKQHGIAHVWNVDEHGHDRESWADNLYHYAQRIFR